LKREKREREEHLLLHLNEFLIKKSFVSFFLFFFFSIFISFPSPLFLLFERKREKERERERWKKEEKEKKKNTHTLNPYHLSLFFLEKTLSNQNT
jgi:hypothetical protein